VRLEAGAVMSGVTAESAVGSKGLPALRVEKVSSSWDLGGTACRMTRG
jgi:hypothetical protein